MLPAADVQMLTVEMLAPAATPVLIAAPESLIIALPAAPESVDSAPDTGSEISYTPLPFELPAPIIVRICT